MEKLLQEEIRKAVEVLRQGGTILYPTDTVWGIGCDATSAEAVKKVYEIKRRADSKALLVLVDSASRILSYVDEVPDMAWQLIEITDKPLTIIYPEAKNLAANLIAADRSIGIRVTKELFSKNLCEQFRKPIVSTSANISGNPTPSNFSQIDEAIKSAVDYVVNWRQDEKSEPKPSSIIKLDKGNVIQIIRQ